MLVVIRDLWVECNVLRKIAVYIRQCFADKISRASLTDAKDKNSKFARNVISIHNFQMIPIDIMEAQNLRKGTEDKVNTIEDIIQMYIERETLIFQQREDAIEEIDQ